MGGTTDWATDLETYNDPPTRPGVFQETSADFKLSVKNNQDPWQIGNWTGNWTDVHCTDQSVEDVENLTPSQRWNMMDAPDAWADALDTWKKIDRPNQGGYTFSQSVAHVIHAPPLTDCGELLQTDNCSPTLQCDGFDTLSSGAAGWAIWTSFVEIHEVRTEKYTGLLTADKT
jgi:hypothetical protein